MRGRDCMTKLFGEEARPFGQGYLELGKAFVHQWPFMGVDMIK
jgi:hypothetical protein